jgi:peptidoglycan/xylan/chitin deacetylase (PgdA/CDA1 family)
MIARKILKKIWLSVSYFVSLFCPQKHKPLVLMYHSVGGFNFKHSVSPEAFEMQLKHLKDRFNVVSLSEIVLWNDGKVELPKRSVALTFDDGYKDNFTVMLPLLLKYKIPATLFLTTNLEKMDKLGSLERLNESDIIALSESGLVKIEAHGHSHKNLTSIAITEAESDIVENKEKIKLITSKTPQFFAYPFGYKNAALKQLASSHFEAAFGITEGRLKKGDDPYIFKRIQVDNTVSFFEFKLRLTGAVDVNRYMVDLLRKVFKNGK